MRLEDLNAVWRQTAPGEERTLHVSQEDWRELCEEAAACRTENHPSSAPRRPDSITLGLMVNPGCPYGVLVVKPERPYPKPSREEAYGLLGDYSKD